MEQVDRQFRNFCFFQQYICNEGIEYTDEDDPNYKRARAIFYHRSRQSGQALSERDLCKFNC